MLGGRVEEWHIPRKQQVSMLRITNMDGRTTERSTSGQSQ